MAAKSTSVSELADHYASWLSTASTGSRLLIAIVGAPASGKSTLAQKLVKTINEFVAGAAMALSMDGFHFDDDVLIPRGWRSRKGAPHTFDVASFHDVLVRLRTNNEPFVVAPRFDRSTESSRSAAIAIDRTVRIVVVEGNYLLYDGKPWASLAELFDESIFIDVDEETLEARLRERWSSHGVTVVESARRIFENDLPNGRTVRTQSAEPTWRLTF